ncbi:MULTISPECIES: ATP adenylyltransferase family protein [unclassified Coleofasciculus]|uniref:ATP adenylyltransferase family protein n=1 Tax=unclassified Coleofasciculus TaxID=2692782 RepID=UPI00187F9A77|nr:MULTISPECIES: phosphorylase [unclassified Coleofasciculus]MBE9129712.1 phosphorylase [Coleofasciculus sp. LEGE 07081]MBE9149676.1 phosphorylase [Coleofasciculus sp. LEGE 07092]
MPDGKRTARETVILESGTLWSKVTERTEHALRCGALQPISTEYEFVEQSGIRFLVRILSNLVRKDEAHKKQEKEGNSSKKEFNPFLPYEEDLFVTDISETHLCLLNKFNVVDHHLLIVTREFEEQDNWLNIRDFEAMWACLAEIDGLAFYNGGKVAGASQRHKHLQLVPFPLTPEGLKIPIEPAITSARFRDAVGTIPDFKFKHALVQLDSHSAESPLDAAAGTLKLYHTLLRAVGLLEKEAIALQQSAPYNLLATRQWMLIVPRSQEDFASISVNSLGFAGALLVRNQQQMQILKEQSPITILQNVAQSH